MQRQYEVRTRPTTIGRATALAQQITEQLGVTTVVRRTGLLGRIVQTFGGPR